MLGKIVEGFANRLGILRDFEVYGIRELYKGYRCPCLIEVWKNGRPTSSL